ncbi:MAG TPA: phosphatidate cytidylyltransferase [Thermoanaerobaculia bacterium]|nr:phosphatidate cytidylyltransferase [Thermoanaerobaculia bacterium]
MKRELAAAVAIPLVLAILFLLPPVAFDVLVVAIALATVWEFFRIAEKTGLPVAKTVGLISSGVLLLTFAAALAFPDWPRPDPALVAAICVALVLLAAVAPLFGGVDLRAALGGASGTVFGVVSIALPATAMCYLRLVSPRAVLLLFLIVWGCDSFAYYTGRAFGRRKLAPRVSPNKTWEGTLGGLAGATLIGGAGGQWLVPELGPAWGAAAGALASSAGQVGDLVESLWKRGAGVKDSGTFLPGHGGFYDRIDSLLFAGPVLAAILLLIRRPG